MLSTSPSCFCVARWQRLSNCVARWRRLSNCVMRWRQLSNCVVRWRRLNNCIARWRRRIHYATTKWLRQQHLLSASPSCITSCRIKATTSTRRAIASTLTRRARLQRDLSYRIARWRLRQRVAQLRRFWRELSYRIARWRLRQRVAQLQRFQHDLSYYCVARWRQRQLVNGISYYIASPNGGDDDDDALQRQQHDDCCRRRGHILLHVKHRHYNQLLKTST